MRRIAVQIVAEGFLHPSQELDGELVDASGWLRLPVASLSAHLQFFRCRVESTLAPAPVEFVLVDAPARPEHDAVQRVLATRFPESTTLLLRSQATGRATVDCPPESPLSEGAAAAVAVVMYSAAWDESETIAVEGGGSKHVFAVGSDDAGHWAEPVTDGR